MELSERCIKTLEGEGFPHIYEWSDTAGVLYEPHQHQDRVTLFVVDGSIEMNVASEKFTLKTGDRYDVPSHTLHSAIVGPKGCQFVVGEMITGDS